MSYTARPRQLRHRPTSIVLAIGCMGLLASACTESVAEPRNELPARQSPPSALARTTTAPPVELIFVPNEHFVPEDFPQTAQTGGLPGPQDLSTAALVGVLQSQFEVAHYLKKAFRAGDKVILEGVLEDVPAGAPADEVQRLLKRAYSEGFPDDFCGVNTVLKASTLVRYGGALALLATGRLPAVLAPGTSAQTLQGLDDQIAARIRELGRFDIADPSLKRRLTTDRHRELRRKVEAMRRADPSLRRIFVIFGAEHDLSDVFGQDQRWTLRKANIALDLKSC